jgi:hypothetical protein
VTAHTHTHHGLPRDSGRREEKKQKKRRLRRKREKRTTRTDKTKADILMRAC